MANPSVTYTFTNGTTADATQVNQNFTDIINGLTDGTKDLSVSAITAAGNVTFNGNTTIGNASGDDLTVTASLASSIPIKTTATYDFGSSTKGLAGLYLGNSTFTTKLATGATASWTFTLPVGAGIAGQGLVNQGSGTVAWKYMTADTSAKSADYTVTDTDMIRTILMTTSSTDRVVTLPTAADNAGRMITVMKVDSGTGRVTVKGEAAGETVGGASGTTGKVLHGQYESMTVHCDGSVWHITDQCLGPVRSFTPTGSWSANTTYSGMYQRITPDSVRLVYFLALSGAPTAATLNVNLPSNMTIDGAKLPGGTATALRVGDVTGYDSSAANTGRLVGDAIYQSSTALQINMQDDDGSLNNHLQTVNAGNPVTWASGDRITIIAVLPISEWA